MPAGSELRRPAASADMQAAAEYFMDIAHGERDVIQAAFAVGQLQQEQVVMTAVRRTTHERATPRIAIRRLEAKQVVIELFLFGHAIREEHDMAHFDGFGAFIHGTWRIDAQILTPHVRGRSLDIERVLARDFNANRHAVRVDATYRIAGFEVTRLTGELPAQSVEFCGGRDTPCH